MVQATLAGVDLGGTNVRLGVVRGDEIVHRERRDVGDARCPETIIHILQDMLRAAAVACGPIVAVGVGAPGIVNPHEGVIIRSPHFPAWVGFAMREALREASGIPVVLDNDANMIALGEANFGAARTLDQFWMLTFGTGIGGACVLQGRVQTGIRGYAGEVGHMVINPDGERCACSGRGHWENYASASGFAQLLRTTQHEQQMQFIEKYGGDAAHISPEAVAVAAEASDAFAIAAWERFGRYVAAGVASLSNVTGLEHFVIGGGLSAAWKHFMPAVRSALCDYIYDEVAESIQFFHAELGDDAGIMGAAACAQQHLEGAV